MLAADTGHARAEGSCTFFSALEENRGFSFDWVPELQLITAEEDDELTMLLIEWE